MVCHGMVLFTSLIDLCLFFVLVPDEVLQLEEKLRELKLANQRLARNSRGNFADLSRSMEQLPASSAVPAYVVDERELGQLSSGAVNPVSLGSLGALLICALLCWRLM